MPKTDKINYLISLMFNTGRLIYKQSHRKNRANIFSFLQLEVLNYVLENKEPLMKDVANFLCITPASATSLINRLVKAGMLERHFDKNDRRVIRLFITSKGKKALKKEFRKSSLRLRKILTKLNQKEQENLIRIFQKLQKIYSNKQGYEKVK